ncbi:hypothetical protein POL68_01485 [Stigmatella sp. ncwal1]|uniref:Uncharacterized protein n=1 Tax=Stigmatella ashevillensis TaxID=2995309 RepID=A0ABT5D4E3_9BACT|nr:hypothetical protein [Stigmatella ashevillena]MDC0707131.1 hypothetical protein [Stigmatella ashevillena]
MTGAPESLARHVTNSLRSMWSSSTGRHVIEICEAISEMFSPTKVTASPIATSAMFVRRRDEVRVEPVARRVGAVAEGDRPLPQRRPLLDAAHRDELKADAGRSPPERRDADGLHSRVRKLAFGPEEQFSAVAVRTQGLRRSGETVMNSTDETSSQTDAIDKLKSVMDDQALPQPRMRRKTWL